MKKLGTLLIIGTIWFNVNAQTNPNQTTPNQTQSQTYAPAADRAKKMTEVMDQKLDLNDDQMKQVGDINLKFARRFDDVVGADGTNDDKANRVQEINRTKEDELKLIFTETQYKTYMGMKDDFVEKMRETATEK